MIRGGNVEILELIIEVGIVMNARKGLIIRAISTEIGILLITRWAGL